MKKGGRLIASGIIEPRAQEVDRAVEKYGFCKIGSKKENGWLCRNLRKKMNL